MKYLPWLVLAVALFFGWSWHERKVGELNGKIAHLVTEEKQRDSVYRVEVSAYANQMLHYKNLRDTVKLTDTVWVKRFIVVADSTIHACNALVVTCEQRVAIRDSIITVLKRKPSVWSHLPWVLGGIIAGKILLK